MDLRLFSATCLILAGSLLACRTATPASTEEVSARDSLATAPDAGAVAPQSVEQLAPAAFVDALRRADDPYLIDCRTPDELAGGQLDGATNLNFNDPTFGADLAALDRERPVFVYCQAGGRSARSAKLLQELGFRRVVDMTGGFNAYRAEVPQPE